jgi:hypothetical protein
LSNPAGMGVLIGFLCRLLTDVIPTPTTHHSAWKGRLIQWWRLLRRSRSLHHHLQIDTGTSSISLTDHIPPHPCHQY